ncbi:UDP-glucosyltransferase 2 [Amyelois transitella]|uniref:UDP-glucosyltransferase 2 n=1 Tax=Amyelois transitella TaxID=680683 RepID=UPI00298F4B88|nr:UDP-glucosyltransferase 2 [Amyelois transitella]
MLVCYTSQYRKQSEQNRHLIGLVYIALHTVSSMAHAALKITRVDGAARFGADSAQCSARRRRRQTAMRAVLLAALLAAAGPARAARVLGLFPHTGKSHQMVFEPLLRRLAERGHHVTVASFFPLADPPENYTDVSLQGIAPLGLETIDLALFENQNWLLTTLGVQKIVNQINEFQPLAGMALDVCSKLVSWSPLEEALRKEYDVVLVENFNSDCMLGLMHIYGLQAPTVALLSSGLMQWSAQRVGVNDNPAYVPIVSSSFTSRMTFLERLENTVLNVYYKLWYRHFIQVKEQELIEKHFGRKIPDLESLSKNISLMLVNVFHSLNGVKPLLPGVVEVGGMHLDHSEKPIPEYMERFLNESEHGVVLFSFGSLIKTATLPPHKERLIVRALARLRQRVIWKYEDSGELGTRQGNILKVRWIPQYQLLRHKKVVAFVGHGGLLGMTEAVAAGKPMVVVPFFGDQPQNAAAAAAAGMATTVSYADLTEESFTEALHTVLSAEVRLNARRLSSMWHDRAAPPLDTAVFRTERAARWGPRDPLHAAARDLGYIQIALLDVAAAVLLAVCVLVLLVILIVSIILRILKRLFSSKRKEKLH